MVYYLSNETKGIFSIARVLISTYTQAHPWDKSWLKINTIYWWSRNWHAGVFHSLETCFHGSEGNCILNSIILNMKTNLMREKCRFPFPHKFDNISNFEFNVAMIRSEGTINQFPNLVAFVFAYFPVFLSLPHNISVPSMGLRSDKDN